MVRKWIFWWLNEPRQRGQCGGGSTAQTHVKGTIPWNQCILSHLKASEPFVAFQSHEVPLFAGRLAPNSQVGHEHGCIHTHVWVCAQDSRRNGGPLAAAYGLKSVCART